jgi:hypothetical protein
MGEKVNTSKYIEIHNVLMRVDKTFTLRQSR